MISMPDFQPETDLRISRTLVSSPRQVWRAWTEAELLKQWFCPQPWSVAEAILDIRLGGIFHTTMRSPEGELHPYTGAFLHADPERLLVWTTVFGPGCRPKVPDMDFTAFIALQPDGTGTRYDVHLLHASAETCRKHAEMGFEEGWGAAIAQLDALAQTL